jgi:hypothetical protein
MVSPILQVIGSVFHRVGTIFHLIFGGAVTVGTGKSTSAKYGEQGERLPHDDSFRNAITKGSLCVLTTVQLRRARVAGV